MHQKPETTARMSERGFTLIELLITMVIFVFTIAAASQIFTGLLTQFKQQSRIAETNIEGIVGLDILRQDIEHAGLGLPWNVTGIDDINVNDNLWDEVPGYTEASSAPYTDYNDAPNNPPGPFRSGNGAGLAAGIVAGSDYLVIKSAGVAPDDAAGKNTRLQSAPPYVRTWALYTEDLSDTDRVIVLSPGSTDSNSRSLVVTGGSYHTQYSAVSASYAPVDDTDVRLVYGISNANPLNTLRAPFNRADYYISAIALPRCATGTGVLVKAALNHSASAGVLEFTEMPLLDCVADMQVIYALDNDDDGDFENGSGDAYSNSLAGLTSLQIRTRVKEVQVYILAHEGQRDPDFTFDNFTAGGTSVTVGRSAVFGRDFDLSAITDYLNYRWKVYTINVRTSNLSSL
ncbi:MAG: prepilin-type N-terminal cleavage/methylation domain-containing protein [Nitrospiraceae bacterium]|nr:MAG: prepilin-type N-terminal cleavage/methylation domain-containing protein [Nitrospiraceae bacterium]